MSAKLTPDKSDDAETCVSLWSAKIPYIGLIAVHHWFVIEASGYAARWEVWQSKGAGGEYWGHLHKDLMPPNFWPHKDEPLCHQRWHGDRAVALREKIEAAPMTYPWLQTYRYWPGPNSNTYVQWVLRGEFRLGWRAAGKHFSRFA